MMTTPQPEAGTGADGTKAVALQLSELVLRTEISCPNFPAT
ncbi:hypothetical protein [Streptomyces sp. NBC_01314]|nr:hypothetical protein OG622_46640 [Streptomyces sp. NBC_01314]